MNMQSPPENYDTESSIFTPMRLFWALLILLAMGAINLLAAAGSDRLYTVTKIRTLTLKTEPSAIAWSPDGKQIAALSDLFSRVTVWNSETGELVREIEIAKSMPASNWLTFTPDGQYILVAADDNDVVNRHASATFWDVNTGTPAQYVAAPFQGGDPRANIAKAIALSHDGNYLALRSTDRPGKQIALYSHKDWRTPFLLPVEGDIANCIEFSPDDRLLAVGTILGSLVFFDVEDRRLTRAIHVYEPGGGGVRALAFSPNGHWVATGYGGPIGNKSGKISSNEPLQLIDVSTAEVLAKSRTSSPEILSVSWSNDGKILAASDDNNHVALTTPPVLGKATGDLVLGGPVLSIKFAPNKSVFAAVSKQNSCHL